ncbi:MAG: tyrosine-type recombinase/integrase, partial [Micromonosporaceae bacterium]
LAKNAGLPQISLHDGRHTAASLALEAGIEIKIVADQLGHSTTRITQDLYTHVRRSIHGQAAEAVVKLLDQHHGSREQAGS